MSKNNPEVTEEEEAIINALMERCSFISGFERQRLMSEEWWWAILVKTTGGDYPLGWIQFKESYFMLKETRSNVDMSYEYADPNSFDIDDIADKINEFLKPQAN